MKKFMVLLLLLTFNALGEDREMGSLGFSGAKKGSSSFLNGKVTLIRGVGGESSGYGLWNGETLSSVEIDSQNEEVLATFTEMANTGKEVIIKGAFQDVSGVAIRLRKVFFVDQVYVAVVENNDLGELPMQNDGVLNNGNGSLIGMGGPLMYNSIEKRCLQSLSTVETARLSAQGWVAVNKCPLPSAQ